MAHQSENYAVDLNAPDRAPHAFQTLETSALKSSSLWKIGALAVLASLNASAQEPVNYEEHIKPLFRSHCNQCHNPDKGKGGLDMSTYGMLMKGGGSGVSVVAGDPDGSLLYLSMTHAKEPFMPKEGDKRPAAELDLVKRWIAGGLIERRGGVARVAEKAKISFDASAMVGAKPAGPPPMPDFTSEPPGFVSDRANAIHAMAASPWAPLVAVGGSRQIVLYNPDTSDLLATIQFPEGEPNVLRFSRNAKLLMCGGGVGGKSGSVVLWDVVTGERVAEVGDEYDSVLAADVRADQKLVALGGPARIVRVFNTSNGEKLYQIKKHTEWVTAIEFSPDGILLATGDRNGGLFIWEAEGGQPFFDLAGHQGMITRVSWRGDGNALASASEDGSVKLWNAHDGKLSKTITAHAGGVQAVEFARDGKLVTCGRDKTVKIWSTDGNLIKTISDFGDMATAVVATHNSARIVAGDWAGQVKVFAMADGGYTGKLRANPPSLAAQILDAAAQREPAQKRVNDLKALADSANATLAQKQKEFEAAQNDVAEKAAAISASETALAAARKDVDEANAQLAAAKQEFLNREADLAMRNERARKATEREGKARGENDELNRQLAEQSKIIEDMKKLVAAAQSAALPTPNDAAIFDQLENSARRQKEADGNVASLNQRIPVAIASLDKLSTEAKEANSVIKAGQEAVAGGKAGAEQKQNAANQAVAKKDEAEKNLATAKSEKEQADKNAGEKQNAVNDAKTAASNATDIAAAAQQDLVSADKRSDRLKAEQFDAIMKRAENKLGERGEGPFTLDQVVEAATRAVGEIQPVAPPKKVSKTKDPETVGAKPAEVPRALLFLGRFHMVLLHLPIGSLLLALLLELDRLVRKTEQTDYIITQTLRFGAAFAVISAVLGYLLSLDTAYDPAEVSLHKWLGIAATVAAVIAAWTRNHRHAVAPYVYWLTIVATAVLLSLAGHNGGELTHGRDFLVKYYPDFASVFRGGSTGASDNSDYARKIQPILEKNCIACHGPEKEKGELRLDLKAKAYGPGESGKKAIVPGNALASECVRRMLLPRDHDDVMPPSNKPPLKDADLLAIVHWINEGAAWPDDPIAPVATNAVKSAAATVTTNTAPATNNALPAAATNAPPAPATNSAPAAAPAK